MFQKSLNGKWSLNHLHCIDCGRTSVKHQAKGRCSSCYTVHRYKNDEVYRERIKWHTIRWMKDNPERWREINNRALKKFYDKKKAG